MGLPRKGMAPDAVLQEMRERRQEDARWQEGRTFSLVYHAGEDHTRLLADALTMFLSENALSPTAFPSLLRFEREVLQMVAELLNGPQAVGSLTSGGTESILLAVKAARDHAGLERPRMVLPSTAHPAFHKAGRCFGVEAVVVPVGEDLRADPEAMAAAMDDRTVLLVGSAPGYPYGVVDPIEALGALALSRGVPLHVDACFGGMLLPFVERLGEPVPPFDFRVDGVTSISADLHKYGYAAKGASTLLYRDRAMRRSQFCAYAAWPGGLYGSPTLAGTRPGGIIAAAWAAMHHLGEEGYLHLARVVVETSRRLQRAIEGIDGLHILGDPVPGALAFGAEGVDIYAVGDLLQARGWHLDRQQDPPSLHLTVTPVHAEVAEVFLEDLAQVVVEAREAGPGGGVSMYGMVGALPEGLAEEAILQFMDGVW